MCGCSALYLSDHIYHIQAESQVRVDVHALNHCNCPSLCILGGRGTRSGVASCAILPDRPSYMPISGGPVSGCNEVKIDEEIYDDQESVVRGTQTTERYPRVEFTSLNLSEEDLAIKHTGMCSKMCYCAKVNPSSKDLAA